MPYEWMCDAELPVVSSNCVVLSYSQRLPRRTWPTLSWSWSSPTRQPRASPPARSMRRSSSRRTSCNPASYLISATPVIYETLDTKSLFLYFHLCLLCGGSPFPMAFQMPSERYDTPFCEEQGPQPFGCLPGQDFLGLSPEGWGLWFWDHSRGFSAEPNPCMFLFSLLYLFFLIWILIFYPSCICDIKLIVYS